VSDYEPARTVSMRHAREARKAADEAKVAAEAARQAAASAMLAWEKAEREATTSERSIGDESDDIYLVYVCDSFSQRRDPPLYFKIGRAVDPHRRMANLQTSSPLPVKPLAIYPGLGPREPEVHARLTDLDSPEHVGVEVGLDPCRPHFRTRIFRAPGGTEWYSTSGHINPCDLPLVVEAVLRELGESPRRVDLRPKPRPPAPRRRSSNGAFAPTAPSDPAPAEASS
jgi:hypothetical protein